MQVHFSLWYLIKEIYIHKLSVFYSLSSLEEKKQNEGGCRHVISPPKIPRRDKEWHKDLILFLQGWASVSPHPLLFPLCVEMTLKSQFFSPAKFQCHILYNGAHVMKWGLNNYFKKFLRLHLVHSICGIMLITTKIT